MWNKITNPKTGRKVYTHTRLGKTILRAYIQQLGGHTGPCALKNNRCIKSKVGDGNCILKNGRCKKKPISSSKKWTCPACTLSNPASNKKCDICNTNKPTTIEVLPERKIKAPEWTCPTCTFDNTASNKKCDICSTNKPTTIEVLPVKGLDWIDNSCYLDSSLLCLLSQKNAFTQQLLQGPINVKNSNILKCGQTTKERIHNIQNIQEELRNIQDFIFGNGVERKKCVDLRLLITKCGSLKEFSGNVVNDPVDFLNKLFSILMGSSKIHTLTKQFVEGSDPIGIPGNLICDEYSIHRNMSPGIGIPTTTKLLEGRLEQKNVDGDTMVTTTELIYTPYLIINAFRVAKWNGKKVDIDTNPIQIDPYIRMKNGHEFEFTGVVMHDSAHYVSLFKFEDFWYYYNDYPRVKIKKFNTLEDAYAGIPDNHNPITHGVLYFYAPTNNIDKPECP